MRVAGRIWRWPLRATLPLAVVAMVAATPTQAELGLQLPGGPSTVQSQTSASGGNLAPVVTRISIETGRTTFEGLGRAGTLIDLSESEKVVGVATVDDNGRWRLVLNRSLTAGDHRIGTIARDPGRATSLPGPDVLLSIPEGFAGTAVLVHNAGAEEKVPVGTPIAAPPAATDATASASATDPQRRRAEELATAASERFSEVMSGPEWQRVVQVHRANQAQLEAQRAQAQPPQSAPQQQDDGVLAPVYGWFDRAVREYHDQIVKHLADPKPISTVPSQPAQKSVQASPPQPVQPRTETPASAPPPVRTVQAPPAASPPAASPVAPRTSETKAPPVAAQPAPQSGGYFDGFNSWLSRASQDYQSAIVRKLQQGEAPAVVAKAPSPATPPVVAPPPAIKAPEVKVPEIKTPEVRPPVVAVIPPAMQPSLEQRQAEEARRLEEERRMAEARRADEERRAQELKAEAARRQATLEAAKRDEDQRRADAAKSEEERRRLQQEAQQREAAMKDAQQREAALRRQQEQAEQRQRQLAEEARRAQEAQLQAQQRADEQRRQEVAAREAAQRRQQELAEQQRKAAEEASRRAAAQKRSQESVVASAPSQTWGGYRTEEEYRRALAEASRAPKVDQTARAPQTKESRPIEAVRPPASPPQVSRATADDERERARALAEAARAPKVLPSDRTSRKVAAIEQPPPAGRPSRADAERRAQELLRDETRRIAVAKQKRETRTATVKRSKARVANSTRTRKLVQVEEGSTDSRPRARQTSSAGRGVPPRRKRERPVAECPAAGRRVGALPGTYIVRSGDTLRKIARQHYNDPGRARAILRANRGRISDPDDLTSCQRIRLPARA